MREPAQRSNDSQGPNGGLAHDPEADPQVRAGVTLFSSRAGVDGPAAFTSSVWGIHDTRTGSVTEPSGCGYYRIVLPFDQLKAHGWDARYGAGTPPQEAFTAKIIAGERLMYPEVLGQWRRLRLRHRLVYEIDDDVWTIDPTNTQAYRAFSRFSILDAVETSIATSDMITVTTERLAEVIRERTGHSRIRIVPNCIPAKLLEVERTRRQHVTVGWAGGSSHGRDLTMIAHPVRQVIDKDRRLRLHLVGQDFRRTFGVLSFARYTPWRDDTDEYYRSLDFDIGLAPIEPSTFNAAKSHIKCLEYAALGIPVVASDFLPYQGFVVDGVTGFLCRTPKQWRERIRELANDSDLRESMGAKARELAAQHTIEGNWHRWAAVYKELLT
jgi:glycosyltransferase involved in cell wall biosynthesis